MVAWSLIFELWFYLVFSAFLLCREKWLPTLLASWALGLIIFNVSTDLEAFSPLMKIVLHPYALEFILGSAAGLIFSAAMPTEYHCAPCACWPYWR